MKKIIITGTSRGIGLELVKQLAEEGHQILALSRNPKPVQALKLDKVSSLSFDITRPDDRNQVRNFVENEWKQVDILIHNAGALIRNTFDQITLTDLQKVYEVNVFGVYALTQILLPFLKKESHVVAVSSMGGIQGSVKFPELTAYSSSKAAVINLMEVLAEEYKETGPVFNALALGAVQTEMFEEAFPGGQAGMQPKEMATYIANFAQTGQKVFNGKVLQVSNSTP